MKSDIKFISDEKDNKLKKELLDLLKRHMYERIEKGKAVTSPNICYELLIQCKYIIERENLDVSKIIEGDTKELIDYLKKEYSKFNHIENNLIVNCLNRFELYEIIKKIIYEDYYINTYTDRVLDSYIDKDKKYLVISNNELPFINYPNVDIFVKNISTYRMFISGQYDEIVGIRRNHYDSLDNVNLKEYDSIIYINNTKEFIEYRELLGKKIKEVNNILMICSYSTISKYRDRFTNIKSILIDKDKAYIEYYRGVLFRNKDDYKICIKELSNIKDEELKDVISSDKEIENVCVYASLADIRSNRFRIGFKAYNKEINQDRNRILRLIDYNDEITKKIRELDNEISNQIDRMIVR